MATRADKAGEGQSPVPGSCEISGAARSAGRFAVPVECCRTTASPTRSVLFRTVPAFRAPATGNSSDRRAATLPKGTSAACRAVR